MHTHLLHHTQHTFIRFNFTSWEFSLNIYFARFNSFNTLEEEIIVADTYSHRHTLHIIGLLIRFLFSREVIERYSAIAFDVTTFIFQYISPHPSILRLIFSYAGGIRDGFLRRSWLYFRDDTLRCAFITVPVIYLFDELTFIVSRDDDIYFRVEVRKGTKLASLASCH